MKQFEYKGYTVKQEKDWVVLYDPRGNYLKRNPSSGAHISRGIVTEMKNLIDKYIKEN